jgi:pilus assembly protein CpaB
MRAMSVKVDEVIGVAGFVVPGTRVDLVVTLRGSGQAEGSMARTVASNVLVLTAGTKFDQEQAKDGKAQPSTVVTLAVSPSDAERVALASSEGRISLALRNPLDVAPTESAGVHVAALRHGTASAPEPAKPQPVAPRRPAVVVPPAVAAPVPVQKIYTVEAIRGAKRTEESVK